MLAAREEAVQSVLREAHARLVVLSQDKQKYKALLTDLLVQVGAGGLRAGRRHPYELQLVE